MTVNSITFFGFLLFTVIIYYSVKPKYQWICLCVASYIFYILTGVSTLVYIFITIISTYIATNWMQNVTKKRKRKILIGLLLLNFGVLLVLKYYGFMLFNINRIAGIVNSIRLDDSLTFVAPLGISYYTLQSMGYAIDVYKSKCKPEKNVFKVALFVGFFPQMTQGPIGRFKDLASQLYASHKFEYRNFSFGCQRILWGLFKKTIIADRLSPVVRNIFNHYDSYNNVTLFLGCVYMTIQIYADFSGYMDIVCGAAEIFGIKMAENFKTPFFSSSLAEYWRRWHITLSGWFRDYLFYPLSISKAAVKFGKFGKKHFSVSIGKMFPAIFALSIVWFATGLWHDASWRYIFWGVANGIIIISSIWLEPIFKKAKLLFHIKDSCKGWHTLQVVRTFLIVSLLKVFPGAQSTKESLIIIKRMITEFPVSISYKSIFPQLCHSELFYLVFGIVVFAGVSFYQRREPVRECIARQVFPVRMMVYLGMIASILLFGVFGTDAVGGFEYAQY